MATTTMTVNPELFTVPANTNEHDINFDDILLTKYGTALVEWVSGTSVQLNANGITIAALAPALTETSNRFILPVKRGTKLKFKGGAGAETFMMTILPEGELLQR